MRTFFIVTAAAATLFSSAVLTQGARQGSASIPDFSGVWVHPYFPGFEPPVSGPGPVLNRSRLPGGPQRGVSNPSVLAGDYSNPILKPWAAEILKRRGDAEMSGAASPTTFNQCWPAGVPFIFFSFWMQMLQQRDKITLIYFDNQSRQVRLNESHPPHVTPSWHGDSIGHYEGDTLVIDTVGIKADRPFAMVDMYGTPHTEALHVVERYRLIDFEVAKAGLDRAAKENFRLNTLPSSVDTDPNYRGKHLQLLFTVEDEGAFTMPWSATITYRRSIENAPEYEFICAENIQWYPGKNAAVPTADKPDF
jgi:hypothetical protein